MHRAHSLPFTHEHGFVSPPPSSASSTAFEVPTVFVHPPEDEAMPFCAFDASQEVAESEMVFTTPEMELVQSELDDWPETVHSTAEHAPAFHRSQTDNAVIMPRRGAISHSSLSRIMTPPGLPSIPESPKRAKEKDDDDIVEVMKVRRGEGMLDVTYAHGTVPTLRRSKTLRSRAAQALRSIKNVGKVPRRPPLGQVFPAKENEDAVKTEVPTQATATVDKHRAKPKAQPTSTQSSLPRLKKRVSQPLTNLFGGGSESVVPSASDAVDLGVSPSHSGGFRTFSYSRKASASTPALQLLRDEPARPTSPSFSLRGTRPKFSFVNLQSIFSGNMQPTPAEPQQVEESPDLDDAVPQTPVDVDDGWDSGEDYDSPRRRVDPGRAPRCSDENAYPEEEISFEMRLNSFHFDSFDIDAEAF
ncbi:hypothetical protein DFH94DRAFT_746517 [Russula ochroleuca]|jgi:hypothetical protein|uniref:Uncharacterized protein n=1 Tax=Russula ochroleuca TaxID=152965 RepID=A0A9P5MU60_9AGAM|nr:hypothetical protein DFH94DRAFT_746517 [Russula ochroleuca]